VNIRTNALWLIGCRISGDALSLVLFVVISRRFGPVGTGAFSYGYAVASLLAVIVSLGIDTYGVRQYVRSPPERRSSWMGELLGTQLSIVTASLIGLTLYVWLTQAVRATTEVILALAFYQVAVGVSRTLFIPANSQERMVAPAVADLTCRLLAVGIALAAIVFCDSSLPMALLGFPAGGLLLIAIGIVSAVRHGGVALHVNTSYRSVIMIARNLFSYAAAEIAGQIFSRIGLVVLTVSAGEAAVGLYAAALKLLELACMPLVFLANAAYPRLIKLHERDGAGFQRLSANLLWLTVLLSGGIAWGLYFVAPVAVVPVLGGKFSGTEPILRVMAGVAVVQAIEAVLWPILLAAGLQVARMTVIVVATVVSLALNVILVPKFGIYGAVLASFVSVAIIVVLFGAVLRRALHGAVLSRTASTLFASTLLAIGATWMARNTPILIQMPISLGVFVCCTALSYGQERRQVAIAR
jgi:O-antigen/teichoic acid export membrane protein